MFKVALVSIVAYLLCVCITGELTGLQIIDSTERLFRSYIYGDGLVVQHPTLPAHSFAGDGVTYTMQVRLISTSTNWMVLFQKGATDQVRSPGVFINIGTGSLHPRYSTASNWDEGISNVVGIPFSRIGTSQYTHLAIVLRKNYIKVYSDGVLTGNYTGNTATETTDALKIGETSLYDLDANIKNFRFYPQELSVSEILVDKALLVSPGAYVSLNSTGSTNSSNAISTTIVSSAYEIIGATPYNFSDSNPGPIVVPHSSLPAHSFAGLGVTYTMQVDLVKTNPDWTTLFQKGALDTNRSPGVFFNPGQGTLHVRYSTSINPNDGTDLVPGVPSSRLGKSKYTHLAFVLRKNYIKVFTDGALVSTYTGKTALENYGNLRIGKTYFKNLTANIRYFRFYPFELSQEEVIEDMGDLYNPEDSTGNPGSVGIIVGSIIGGCVALGIISYVCCRSIQKQRPPVKNVEIQQRREVAAFEPSPPRIEPPVVFDVVPADEPEYAEGEHGESVDPSAPPDEEELPPPAYS